MKNKSLLFQNYPRVFSFLFILLFLVPLFLTGCEEEPPPPDPIRAVKWLKVSEPSAEQQRRISGFIRAKESSELNFDVSGLVVKYHGELGDSVKKGQVLAQLDPEPFQLNVREAKADVAKARARLLDAKSDYRRTRLLYEADNVSKADLDQARANFDAMGSQVKAAESKLGIAQRDLRKSTLRAPFNGMISERNLNVGERVIPANVVYKVDGTSKGLQVQVDVPEVLITKIQQGQTVTIRFPANNQTTPGTISEVGTRAGSGNAFPVKADLQEDLAWARPGMTAEVLFTFAPTEQDSQIEGFMIPIDSVVPAEGRTHFVFVFDQGTSTVRKIKVHGKGIRDNKIDVVGDLKAGDIIVAAGAEFLMDGQEVTLLEEQKF